MKALICLVFVLASNFSYADRETITELTKILDEGKYSGRSSDGKKCEVEVLISSYGYVVSVTPEDFDVYRGDNGSTECMGEKACFQLKDDYFNYRVLDKKDSSSSYFVQVKRVAAASNSAKKMSVTFTKNNTRLNVAIVETVGIFGLGSTKANCTISK